MNVYKIDCQSDIKMEKYSMKSRQILKSFLASGVLVFLTGCYADLQKADNEMQREIRDLQSGMTSGQDAVKAAEAAADAASEAAAKAEAAADASQEKAVEAERIFERDLGKK